MKTDALIEAAQTARLHAYAPYSGYLVGAALEDAQGRIWSACNVENVSFGLSVCAERAAIARMVAEGGREIRALAVATVDGGTPCGMCLQSIAEFAPDPEALLVVTVDGNGASKQYSLKELMPHGFASSAVRTNG